MTTAGSSPYVDYERIADRYRHGRAIPATALDRWGAVVRQHLDGVGGRTVRVVDVGAGTGIFAAAWPSWTAATVLAVEPALAMIRAGGPAIRYVRAVAECLPLPAGSFDVVWVSTALHHFADPARAVREFGRVLTDAGQVMVRTYLPGRTEITWLSMFPGVHKAWGRLTGLDELDALFSAGGFGCRQVSEVHEETWSFGQCADWVERMRHADSMLTALTDEEVAAGVRTLRATPTEPAHTELSLVTFDRYPGISHP